MPCNLDWIGKLMLIHGVLWLRQHSNLDISNLNRFQFSARGKALTILVVGMLKSGYAQRKVQHKIAIQPSNKTEVDLWKFHGGRDRACWAESLQFVAKRFQSHGNQQRWAARPTTLAMRLIMLCIQFQAFVSHCQDTRNRTPLNRKQAHSCKGVCRLGWIKGTEMEPVHTHNQWCSSAATRCSDVELQESQSSCSCRRILSPSTAATWWTAACWSKPKYHEWGFNRSGV